MSEESSEFDQQIQRVNDEILDERRERYEEELKQDEEEDNEIEREKQQTQDLKEIREAEIEECANEILAIHKYTTRERIKEILNKYIK